MYNNSIKDELYNYKIINDYENFRYLLLDNFKEVIFDFDSIEEIQAIGDAINEYFEKYNEPTYYTENGCSPLTAMEKGLISHEEYIGFLKGNVIKYISRAGKKDNSIQDIDKAIDYLQYLKKEYSRGE